MIRRASGFSLIELMIVIAIIGVLAAIALPNYINMMNRSREASVQNIAHTLELGVVTWSVSNAGIYPALGDIDVSMFQRNTYPENPFTGVDVAVAAPAYSQGDIGYASTGSDYLIVGYGSSATSGPAADGIVIRLTNN